MKYRTSVYKSFNSIQSELKVKSGKLQRTSTFFPQYVIYVEITNSYFKIYLSQFLSLQLYLMETQPNFIHIPFYTE